jgi:hypothetical protein
LGTRSTPPSGKNNDFSIIFSFILSYFLFEAFQPILYMHLLFHSMWATCLVQLIVFYLMACQYFVQNTTDRHGQSLLSYRLTSRSGPRLSLSVRRAVKVASLHNHGPWTRRQLNHHHYHFVTRSCRCQHSAKRLGKERVGKCGFYFFHSLFQQSFVSVPFFCLLSVIILFLSFPFHFFIPHYSFLLFHLFYFCLFSTLSFLFVSFFRSTFIPFYLFCSLLLLLFYFS